MMKINTLRFGELEVSEDQIFHFPMGILGFASSKSFVIIDLESQKPFKWLQSIDDPSTAFVLSDPLLVHPSYCAVVERNELSPLGEINEDDLIISVIVTISERPEDTSANLCAPLIFNLANRRGMQYVLNDRKYPIRFRIFQNDTKSAQPAPAEIDGGSCVLSLR
jgi:flagellar assembly factor FliW